MIPATFVNDIAGLKSAAEYGKRIITAPEEPGGVYYVAEGEGSTLKLRRETAVPPPIRDNASDLASLVAWLAAFDEPGEIWYSRDHVVASPKRAGQPASPSCSLALSPSPQLAYLADIGGRAAGEKYTQKQFIRTLRTTLFGTHGGDLLAAVRNVSLQKAKDVVSQQVKGRVSLERKDIAEMSGASAIPDVITFDVPIFSAASVPARASVQCDLDLDADSETFVLTVLPGEIERAFAKGEAWLQNAILDLLGTDRVPSIYLGAPGCEA